MNNDEKIITGAWIDCIDDNYWQTENDIYCYLLDGELIIDSKRNCPFGWNVLCDLNAKFMTPEPPAFLNREEDNEENF